MKISDAANVLEAQVLCGEAHTSREIRSVFASDLMSDVLAFADEFSLLLTGLVSPQTIRTADMTDIFCVIFVNGKTPDKIILDLADSCEITIMKTQLGMYAACGRLYAAG